jgi:hypothetical protein
MKGDSKITPTAAPNTKNEDWEKSLAAGGVPTGVIDSKGLDKEINRQIDEYDTLPFWKSYRGRVVVLFVLLLDLPLILLLQQPRFSIAALVLLSICNIDLILVYLGYRYAIYPLCIAAFNAPIIIGIALPD